MKTGMFLRETVLRSPRLQEKPCQELLDSEKEAVSAKVKLKFKNFILK